MVPVDLGFLADLFREEGASDAVSAAVRRDADLLCISL